MKRFVASILALAMVSGCATYEGARQARNTGIGMEIIGGASLAGGIAVGFAKNDPPCANDGNDCRITDADVAEALLVMTGVDLLVLGLVCGIVGDSGMEKHSPEAQREKRQRDEQTFIENQRIANDQLAQARRENERTRAERDKVHRREHAFALVKSAAEAARGDRCSDALAFEKQVRELDVDVHDTWFVRDPDIKRCLVPSPPPPPVEDAQSR